MKNSNKFVLIVLAAIAIITAILTIVTRNIIDDHLVIVGNGSEVEYSVNADDGDMVYREYDFSDFDSLEISGGWEIRLIEDDEYDITIESQDPAEAIYRVSERNGKLRLSMKTEKVFGHKYGASATIHMPKLDSVRFDGAALLNIEGFTLDELELRIDGAGSVSGDNCEIERLRVESNGAVDADFNDCEIKNAAVFLDGAGNIELNMTGGELTGRISGLANLEYSGEISKLSVDKDGIGSIQHKD